MEEKPVRRVRKRGIRRLFGYIRTSILVILVSLGLIVDAIVSAIHRPFQGKKNIIICTLLIVGLLTGIFFGWRWYRTMNGEASLSQTVTQTLDFPSEASVSTEDFTVASNIPRIISIGSIGTEGVIQPVANDQNSKIASPNNLHAAGWYTSSAKPGEQGLSIINGHLQGRYSKGLFYDLAKLKPGDTFVIGYGNGRLVTFEVKNIRTVSIRDALTEVTKRDPVIHRQLNLIALTNANDKGTPASNERVIVTASAKSQ
jgi:sortase (surface protein transpeptidase)